jgi:hypothetical protein
MDAGVEPREYRPTRLSRRSELIAWGLVLVVGAAWLVLASQNQPAGALLPLLEAFLLFTAASISLGNWMDRRTVLRIDDTGVSYTNGLRRVKFAWPDINQVRVLPGGWGKRVQVLGESGPGNPAYFGFRTSGVVQVQGVEKGRMGFEAGEDIVREIIRRSGLQAVKSSQNGERYSRP